MGIQVLCGLILIISLCTLFPRTPPHGTSEHILSNTYDASHLLRRKYKLHVTYKTLVCHVTLSPLPSRVLHHKSRGFLATGVCRILGRESSTGPSPFPTPASPSDKHSGKLPSLLLWLFSPPPKSPLLLLCVLLASCTHFSPPGTLNILHCSDP